MDLKSSHTVWTFNHKITRLIWMIIWSLFGMSGPRFLSPIRCLLLKLFGAKIGKAPLICGKVSVLMPWNLELGDFVAISEGVNVYNFAMVSIGDNTCVSQKTWICTGTHNYQMADFPLIWAPITIGSECWVAAESFIAPGVEIGNGSVIGARSVVTKSMPEWMVCAGNPCRPIKPRIIQKI